MLASRDRPRIEHHVSLVEDVLLKHAYAGSGKLIKITTVLQIVTFDRGGVTGHKNHMSCWQAVR